MGSCSASANRQTQYAHRLYGIVGDTLSTEFLLVSIDPATGDLTPIVAIAGFGTDPPGPWCYSEPTGMDFDDDGRLWVTVSWYQGCVIIPIVTTGIHFYANPFDGTLTSQSHVASSTGSQPWLFALAVRGPARSLLDIPTLDFAGTLILATALAAAALALVRRRS